MDQVLIVTDKAIGRIRELKEKNQWPEPAIRVRVKAGGCSGLIYQIGQVDAARDDDHVIQVAETKVVVDKKSAFFVRGSMLDYSDEMIGGGFKIVNPQAKAKCSCGLSFAV